LVEISDPHRIKAERREGRGGERERGKR